jgi:16S rRNA (guanine527-N7)-methyltransferase
MELITKYFTNLSDKQLAQFAALDDLYQEWNSKINVISKKDIANLYEHHILHSLAIAKVVDFKAGADILDVGTGGGFPGLPLAIMFPKTNFCLVDSVGKKLKVVEAISSAIGVSNITTRYQRVENLTGQYDFAVSRAVGRLDTVWPWVAPKLKKQAQHSIPNGLLYLKGGDISSELPKNAAVRTWEINQFFVEDYFAQKTLVLISPLPHNKP